MMTRIFVRFGVFIVLGISALVALLSYRFVPQGVTLSFPGMLQHVDDRLTLFTVHVAAAPLALLAGVFQFWPHLRNHFPGAHRWIGRIYGIAVLLGGGAGLALAWSAVGGPIAGAGFALWAALWIGVTAQAVRLAMARQFERHRLWMIRSFALSFAAVTLRLYAPAFYSADFNYAEASVWLAWLCWIPNLMIAEWILRRASSASLQRF